MNEELLTPEDADGFLPFIQEETDKYYDSVMVKLSEIIKEENETGNEFDPMALSLAVMKASTKLSEVYLKHIEDTEGVTLLYKRIMTNRHNEALIELKH